MENYKKIDELEWSTGRVKGFSGKSLIDLKNGGFKMVKVDALSSYPLHLHPNKTEFIYVLEGEPKIVIDSHSYNGSKGDFFTLPSAIKHSIENPANSECLLLVGAINN